MLSAIAPPSEWPIDGRASMLELLEQAREVVAVEVDQRAARRAGRACRERPNGGMSIATTRWWRAAAARPGASRRRCRRSRAAAGPGGRSRRRRRGSRRPRRRSAASPASCRRRRAILDVSQTVPPERPSLSGASLFERCRSGRNVRCGRPAVLPAWPTVPDDALPQLHVALRGAASSRSEEPPPHEQLLRCTECEYVAPRSEFVPENYR